MIRLVVFDLDGTLAPVGLGMTEENIELLKKIEKTGVRVAICSGKPCYYLCGFMRQTGLSAPILVGENGGEIVFGVDLPPVIHKTMPYSKEAKATLEFLRKGFDSLGIDIWYQPNNVGLTPFLTRDEDFDAIARFMEENRGNVVDVDVYRHNDCYDIMPKGISKAGGVSALAKLLSFDLDDVMCVGDGVNDYPMFKVAGHSVGVGVSQKDMVDVNFDTTKEALLYILDCLR